MVENFNLDEVDGGDIGVGADIGAGGLAAGVAAACLSCGAGIAGIFCGTCGQKNDDLRRSSLALARDFMRDTFGFDSRMWRTLGLMAVAPGTVPTNYAHGRRSRYTPPVRLFLVVSFLFFLTLGLTQTMFVAFEITQQTESEIAADKAADQAALARAAAIAPKATEDAALVEVDGQVLACPIKFKARFFVRPKDVHVDQDAWAKCAASISAASDITIDSEDIGVSAEERGRKFVDRAISGVSAAIEDPRAVNTDVNNWLARVMFLMTPALALLTAFFIRGRDALLFDHLILSLYTHATAFAIVGLGVAAAIFGVPHAGAAAAGAIALYFVVALKRTYKRGWIKTLFSAAFVMFFYFLILSSVAMSIVLNAVWQNA